MVDRDIIISSLGGTLAGIASLHHGLCGVLQEASLIQRNYQKS